MCWRELCSCFNSPIDHGDHPEPAVSGGSEKPPTTENADTRKVNDGKSVNGGGSFKKKHGGHMHTAPAAQPPGDTNPSGAAKLPVLSTKMGDQRGLDVKKLEGATKVAKKREEDHEEKVDDTRRDPIKLAESSGDGDADDGDEEDDRELEMGTKKEEDIS